MRKPSDVAARQERGMPRNYNNGRASINQSLWRTPRMGCLNSSSYL
jgi:hypothetical protein